ncbi:hypothetical protein [Candidatus Laterigemmans baculatus]|nr:hypothetical protein [Candidatus Laterigemmans baculatus]
MNAPSFDADSAAVMLVMGALIIAPTLLIVIAVVAGRFRNPQDKP